VQFAAKGDGGFFIDQNPIRYIVNARHSSPLNPFVHNLKRLSRHSLPSYRREFL
jgi:hypothetical protein